jgi:hypothetical protein
MTIAKTKKRSKRTIIEKNVTFVPEELFDTIVAQNKEMRTVAKSLPNPSEILPNHL